MFWIHMVLVCSSKLAFIIINMYTILSSNSSKIWQKLFTYSKFTFMGENGLVFGIIQIRNWFKFDLENLCNYITIISLSWYLFLFQLFPIGTSMNDDWTLYLIITKIMTLLPIITEIVYWEAWEILPSYS